MSVCLKSGCLTGLAVLAAVSLAGGAAAQNRLPRIKPENYDEAQKKAAEDFLQARKTPVFGPFEPLMHSPDVMSLSRAMGDYLRYKSALGPTLGELVILVVAREWTQDYEWYVHAPIALKPGISAETIAAIEQGRRPEKLSDDEDICYQVTTELHRNKQVSDVTYARAQKRFGDRGVVDLTAISGYYALLAMEMNVARYPVPEGAKLLPRLP